MRGGFLDEFLNKDKFLMLKSICTAVMPLQLFSRVRTFIELKIVAQCMFCPLHAVSIY